MVQRLGTDFAAVIGISSPDRARACRSDQLLRDGAESSAFPCQPRFEALRQSGS